MRRQAPSLTAASPRWDPPSPTHSASAEWPPPIEATGTGERVGPSNAPMTRERGLGVLLVLLAGLGVLGAHPARSDAISALASRPARDRLGTQRARQSTQEAREMVHV